MDLLVICIPHARQTVPDISDCGSIGIRPYCSRHGTRVTPGTSLFLQKSCSTFRNIHRTSAVGSAGSEGAIGAHGLLYKILINEYIINYRSFKWNSIKFNLYRKYIYKIIEFTYI